MKANGKFVNHVSLTNNNQSSNKHLLDILDKNYYIELGNVNLKVLERLLKRKKLRLDELFYPDIVRTGTGMITEEAENDIDYQVNYLYSLHQKSSSSKICFTCGTLRYYDEDNIEKFAPIVLIPLSIDYRSREIFMNGEPQVNIKLLTYLRRQNNDSILPTIETWRRHRITDVYSIDSLCIDMHEKTGLSVGTVSYLTLIEVEYREFNLTSDMFEKTKSIFETTDTKLMRDYFHNVLPILPSNIEQKYVILKAHNGDSFVVNGRLGTGKTYSAINIMADFIAQGKKVLYVNQDLDNLNDLRYFLAYLGLEPSVSKLTKNIWNEGNIPLKEISSYNPFNYELIDSLEDLSKIYDKKCHGYPYSYILEKLAILKEAGVKEEFPIEEDVYLERHEIEYLVKILNEIEEDFKHVRKFPENPWSRLLSNKTAPTCDEVMERTIIFDKTNKELVKTLADVCDKFGLHTIKTIREFLTFSEELIAFISVQPLSIWRDPVVREDTKKALAEINESSDINYSALDMYKNITCEGYQKGQMDKTFKEFIKNHYYANSSNDENCVYIDRLLEHNNKLEEFIEDIKLLNKKSKDSFAELSPIFDINCFAVDEYRLLTSLYTYMCNFNPETSWIDEYLIHNDTFGSFSKEYHDAIIKLEESSKAFIEYLIPGEDPYTVVSKIVVSNNLQKAVKKNLQFPMLKKSKDKINHIIDEIKSFYAAAKVITKYYPKTSGQSVQEWENYDEFLNLVTNLTHKQHKALVTAFSKCYHEHNITQDELKNMLKNFSDCANLQMSVENRFNYYNLKFDGHEFLEVVANFTEQLPYLNSALKLKAKIYSYLPHIEEVTCRDIFSVINVDRDYQDVIMKQMRNKDKYIHLLGNAYNGFETDVATIYQAIDHFPRFYSRFKSENDACTFIDSTTFNDLLKYASYFTNLYTQWYNKFRQFSTCFFGGLMRYQDLTLTGLIETMKQYVDYLDECPHAYNIEQKLEEFYKLGLKKFADGIHNGIYTKDLSRRFMLTILERLKQAFYDDSFTGFNVEKLKTLFGDIETNESHFCDTNLFKLRNAQGKEREKKHFIRFNDYNNIIKNSDPQKAIFLADVSIINSEISLAPFDLVILDDVHLTTANKFYRINEARQVVVFGDAMFKSSITNTLIKRTGDKSMITFHKRYIEMNNYFNNVWHWDNQYIYSTAVKDEIVACEDEEQFVKNIIDSYIKGSKLINIIVGSSYTRREIYSLLIKELRKHFDSDKTISILNSDIRLIDAKGDSSRICDYVYIYCNDFLYVDEITANLVVRNYINAQRAVYLCYVKSRIEKENGPIEDSIRKVIGEPVVRESLTGGITKVLFDRLKEKNIDVEIGFGDLDLMIKTDDKNYGFMLLGKRALNSYSIFDDFAYYVSEYTKRNWKIDVIRMEDLEEDFDNVLNFIIQKVTK